MHRSSAVTCSLAVMRRLSPLWCDTRGAIGVEYALLVGLIALVVVGTIGEVGADLIALPLPKLIDAFAAALS